jgi:hypothetical protein
MRKSKQNDQCPKPANCPECQRCDRNVLAVPQYYTTYSTYRGHRERTGRQFATVIMTVTVVLGYCQVHRGPRMHPFPK